MSTAEVGRLVVAVERIGRRVSAAQLSALAQAGRSGVAERTGGSSTSVWLHNVADLPVCGIESRAENTSVNRRLVDRPMTSAASAVSAVPPHPAASRPARH